jgi:hypothetical protein
VTSATRTGIAVGAVLALTAIIFGFWAFVFDVGVLVDVFRGKRSSS